MIHHETDAPATDGFPVAIAAVAVIQVGDQGVATPVVGAPLYGQPGVTLVAEAEAMIIGAVVVEGMSAVGVTFEAVMLEDVVVTTVAVGIMEDVGTIMVEGEVTIRGHMEVDIVSVELLEIDGTHFGLMYWNIQGNYCFCPLYLGSGK